MNVFQKYILLNNLFVTFQYFKLNNLFFKNIIKTNIDYNIFINMLFFLLIFKNSIWHYFKINKFEFSCN